MSNEQQHVNELLQNPSPTKNINWGMAMLIATQLRASHASVIELLKVGKTKYELEIKMHDEAMYQLKYIIETLHWIAGKDFFKEYGIPHPITNASMTCFSIIDLAEDDDHYDYRLIVNGILPKNTPKFVVDLMYPTPTEEELHYQAHMAEHKAEELAKMAEQMNPNNTNISQVGKFSNKKLKKLIKEQLEIGNL